jgi:hydrogenase maturation protease
MRALVAGFGNVLRGDDGFGVAVINELERQGNLGDEVELLDVGIGGMHLTQALLSPYEVLVILDALEGTHPPGTLSVRRVEGVRAAKEVDLHATIPSKALSIAASLTQLPPRIYFIGCQPESSTLEEPVLGLSEPVREAVPRAVKEVLGLLDSTRSEMARA